MAETAADVLARRLAEYPERAITFFKLGMEAAARLPEAARARVLDAVVSNLKKGVRRIEGSTLQPITALSARESEQIASAYSLIIGLLSVTDATPADFLEAGKSLFFTQQQEPSLRIIVESVWARRSELTTAIESTQLAGEVLPSLYSLETTIDVRLRVVSGEVKTHVPVLLLHIDTDAPHNELWLQLSRGEVEQIIERLTNCLKEMEVAETAFITKS